MRKNIRILYTKYLLWSVDRQIRNLDITLRKLLHELSAPMR